MRYINHLSDFQVVINITDKDGNIIAPPLVPWEAVFADENCVEFKCYFDGNNYTHCIVDVNDIVCFIDNPGFSCGKLRCTFCQHVPSEDYSDGVMDLSQPLQCDIMLSKRESDDSTPITIEASPNWVRGPKGEQGIQGIQGEKGADGFSPIVSLTKQGTISTLSITDAQGEHTTDIADGAKGNDGFSPIVSLNKVDKVTTLTITDANGEHTALIEDGVTPDAYTKAESDARYLRGGYEYCGLMEWDGTNEVKIYEMKFDSPKREVFIFAKCKYDSSNKGQFKIIITNGNNIIGISHFSSSSNEEECFHIHNVCGNYVCDINTSNNHIVPNALKRCYMAENILLAINKDVGLITNLKIEITTDLVRIDGVQKWYVFGK